MTTPPPEMSAYAIAGGQTLDFINALKAGKAEAEEKLREMAKAWNANVSFEYGRPSFQFKEGSVPAGWKESTFGRITAGHKRYEFDRDTPEGEQVARDVSRLTGAMNLSHLFNEACAHSCGSCRGPYEFGFETIGDKVVVTCPQNPISSGKAEYLIPPDSTPIAASEYFRLKEEAGLLPAPATKPFQRGFGA